MINKNTIQIFAGTILTVSSFVFFTNSINNAPFTASLDWKASFLAGSIVFIIGVILAGKGLVKK